MSETKIPRWNLDSIFPSIKTDEYKKALADYSASMDDFDKLLTEAAGKAAGEAAGMDAAFFFAFR